MRWVVTADLHFSNTLPYAKMDWTTGVTDRLLDFEAIADFIIDIGARHKAPGLLLLGDTFDRNLLDAVTLTYASKWVRRVAESFERVVVVPGNHENHDARNLYFTSQWLESIKNVHVVSSVTRIGPIVLLPYAPLKKLRATLASIDVMRRKANILATHATFAGATNFGHVLIDGLRPKDVEGFELVLSGHIHSRQDIAGINGFYVGSPYAVDFKDEATKSVTVLDDGNCTHEIVPVPHDVALPFRTIDVDLFDDGSIKTLPKRLPKPQGYLKVRVTGNKSAVGKFVVEMQAELGERGYRHVAYDRRIVRDVAKARSASIVRKGGVDLRQALSVWVESLELPEHLKRKRLEKMGLTLLDVALSKGTETPRRRVSVEPVSLLIRNFGPIRKAKLRLNDAGLVLVRARNKDSSAADSVGSGKTTIFKAITWALFGRTIYGETGNDVIRWGQKAVSVSVKLRVDGNLVRIKREKEKTTSAALTIKHAGSPAVVGGVNELQAQIDDLLGLDFDSFRNTVLFGQGDHKRFADPSTSDATRKTIFREILRLGQLDVARDLAKKREGQAKEAIATLQLELAKVGVTLESDHIETLRLQVDDWEAERKEAIERIYAEGERWERVLASTDGGRNVEAERAHVAKLREAINASHEKREVLAESIRKLRDSSATAIADVRAKIASIDATTNGLKEHLEKLEGDVCPVCNSSLTDDSSTAAKHKRTLNRDLDSCLASRKTLLEKGKALVLQRDKEIGALQVQSREDDVECDRLTIEAEVCEESLRRAIEAKAKVEEAKRATASIKARVTEKKSEENPYTDLLAKAKTERAKAVAESERIQAEVESLEATLRMVQFWVDGFGNSGLQSWIMDSTVQPLNEAANNYLSILADGDIYVDIDTEAKTKRGDSRDKFSVTATIEQNGQTKPSGGQQCKIDLAVGLALMDLVSEREGSNVSLLLLDEIFAGLDREGRMRVVDLLDHLRTRKGTVLVITHDAEIKDSSFDSVITVVKKGGIARVLTGEV